MGRTFVGLNQKGFWVSDGILELWLRLCALHIEEPSSETINPDLCYEIRNQWLLASGAGFGGCIPVCLDEFCQTIDGKNIVMDAINSLMDQLRGGSETLDMDTLNLIGRNPYVGRNIETLRLVEIGLAFVDLINGEFEGDVSDANFMPGSLRNSPYFPEI